MRAVSRSYHALPSLRPLHLHIVSADLSTPALKTKRHWNSFTSPFFLPTDSVERQLREQGSVRVSQDEAEKALRRKLRCPRCEAGQRNMPALKAHHAACGAPNPFPDAVTDAAAVGAGDSGGGGGGDSDEELL